MNSHHSEQFSNFETDNSDPLFYRADPPRQFPRREVGLYVLLLLVVSGLVASILALGAFYQLGPATMFLSSKCSLGLGGTAISISVEGLNANQQCSDLEGSSGPRGAIWYRYDGTPSGSVICQAEHGGSKVVVKDQGAAMLYEYGLDVCSNLLYDPSSDLDS